MSGKEGNNIFAGFGKRSFPSPLSQSYLRHHLGLHRESTKDEKVILHRRWIRALVGMLLIQAAELPIPSVRIITNHSYCFSGVSA